MEELRKNLAKAKKLEDAAGKITEAGAEKPAAVQKVNQEKAKTQGLKKAEEAAAKAVADEKKLLDDWMKKKPNAIMKQTVNGTIPEEEGADNKLESTQTVPSFTNKSTDFVVKAKDGDWDVKEKITHSQTAVGGRNRTAYTETGKQVVKRTGTFITDKQWEKYSKEMIRIEKMSQEEKSQEMYKKIVLAIQEEEKKKDMGAKKTAPKPAAVPKPATVPKPAAQKRNVPISEEAEREPQPTAMTLILGSKMEMKETKDGVIMYDSVNPLQKSYIFDPVDNCWVHLNNSVDKKSMQQKKIDDAMKKGIEQGKKEALKGNDYGMKVMTAFFKKYPDCYPKPELPEACGEIKETETTIVKERSFEDTMTIKEVEVIVREKSKTETREVKGDTITKEGEQILKIAPPKDHVAAMEKELAVLKKQLEAAKPAARVDNTSQTLELQTLLQKLDQLKNKL